MILVLVLLLAGCVTPSAPPIYVCYPAHLTQREDDTSLVGVCFPHVEEDVVHQDITP